MVHLVVLFLGHLQIALQVFPEVPHRLLHHLPKALLDLANGGQLVQSELVVADLDSECHEVLTMRMLSLNARS